MCVYVRVSAYGCPRARAIVHVSPKERAELERLEVPFDVVNEDLQADLDRERTRLERRPARFDNDTVGRRHMRAPKRRAMPSSDRARARRCDLGCRLPVVLGLPHLRRAQAVVRRTGDSEPAVCDLCPVRRPVRRRPRHLRHPPHLARGRSQQAADLFPGPNVRCPRSPAPHAPHAPPHGNRVVGLPALAHRPRC